jgi:hypothetical protein
MAPDVRSGNPSHGVARRRARHLHHHRPRALRGQSPGLARQEARACCSSTTWRPRPPPAPPPWPAPAPASSPSPPSSRSRLHHRDHRVKPPAMGRKPGKLRAVASGRCRCRPERSRSISRSGLAGRAFHAEMISRVLLPVACLFVRNVPVALGNSIVSLTWPFSLRGCGGDGWLTRCCSRSPAC